MLAADTSSLRDTLRWATDRSTSGAAFQRFALKAQTNVVGRNIALSKVNLELDGNSGEGVLTYVADGRQTLQGTLAVEGLNLTPYMSTFRLLTAERSWSRMPLELDALSGIDVDSADFGRPRHARRLQARPDRDRGQSARRQSHAGDRRVARPSAASSRDRSRSRSRPPAPTCRRSCNSTT